MDNWLSSRLTPAKSKEPRWVEFATVLERIWEEFFDPDMSRVERLRSNYTADDADLIKKIREMGDYFAFDLPKHEDRPISVGWRRLELEYKDMELILQSVFRRHFLNLPVTWFPIFAPQEQSAHPYGSIFDVAAGPWPDRKNSPPDAWFLTSRGRLGTDYGALMRTGLSKQEFLDRALPLLKRTKPLHIVYDGVVWYIRFDLPFEGYFSNDGLWWVRESDIYELQFHVMGSRFDYLPADIQNLDIQVVPCSWKRDDAVFIAFLPSTASLWHMDWFLPEGFPWDWLPEDIIIAGNEADSHEQAHMAAIFTAIPFDIAISPESDISISLVARDKPSIREIPFQSRATSSHSILCFSDIAAFSSESRPKRLPRFDDFPADIYPLDITGNVYA